MSRKPGLSYVELSPTVCDAIILQNLRVREKEYGGAHAPRLTAADSKKLAQAIIRLFETVAVKKKTLYRENKEYKQMDYCMTMMHRGFAVQEDYIVPTEFVRAFVQLYDAMATATENTYNSGLERGKNLLVGLNDGTLTMNDFNAKKEK
jgi:hypothetical protein